MRSDDIRNIYIREKLEKGIREIIEAQRSVAAEKIYRGDGDRGRSGALMEALSSPRYMLTDDGPGVRAEITYPLQIRFLDIKRLGNWKIYNRIVWGTLYRKTFMEIRFEFSDWLREYVRGSLTEAFVPLKNI